MFNLAQLTCTDAADYQAMTFPSIRPLLHDLEPQGQIIAIGASWRRQPVGLALAKILPDGNSEVISIFVAARHCGRGVGTALLTRLEQALHERGCVKAELVYMTGRSTTAALEHLLQKSGWAPPQTRMIVCKGDKKILDAPWVKEYSLPPPFTIFPWRELTQDERMVIQRSQEAERWIPECLVPFDQEKDLEPFSSLGLRYQGQVVGWLITHRVTPDTVRFTSLFVREDLQKTGRAIPLVVEAINRQAQELGYDSYAIMSIRHDNAPMVRFLKRRVAPYLASIRETRGTYRLFEKGARRQLSPERET